jgi:hypothetical protein
MGAFLETADRVTQHINPDLQRLGVVVNNVRPTAEDEGFVAMYTQQFGGEVLAVIPQRTAIKEAARLATPIEFFPGAPPDAKRSYREIAARVLDHLGVKRRARPCGDAGADHRRHGAGRWLGDRRGWSDRAGEWAPLRPAPGVVRPPALCRTTGRRPSGRVDAQAAPPVLRRRRPRTSARRDHGAGSPDG